MSYGCYVVYDVKTTVLMNRKRYATEGAAKSAITRHKKKNPNDKRVWAFASREEFRSEIEKSVERINLRSGMPYMERVNTPRCCSPASELYWSM